MLKQNESAKGMQNKIGQMLAVIPLSPNQWTLLSLLIAAIAAYEITQSNLIVGLGLFALAGIFDIVDGAVARARGQVTKLGGFIDGVVDRFVEFLFLFAFMFYPLPFVFEIDSKIWISLLIFIGTCMPSFIRAYADHKGVLSREVANSLGGILERSERIILLVVGLGCGIALSDLHYFVYAIILASVLSLITIMQRISQITKTH